MKLEIKAFGGVAPKQNPRLLPASGAQIALNCEAVGETVRPLRGHNWVTNPTPTFVLGGAALSTAKAIYRFGQDETTDNTYWMAWTNAVDVCRSQIADDKMEWTYYTEEGSYPKMFNAYTKGTANEHWRLGIPAPYGDAEEPDEPTQKVALAVEYTGPLLRLLKQDWSKFTTAEGLDLYFKDERNGQDREIERVHVSFSSVTLNAITSALNAASFNFPISVTSNAKDNSITLVTDAAYLPYTLYLSWGGYKEFGITPLTRDGSVKYIPAGTSTYPQQAGWKAFKKRYGFTLNMASLSGGPFTLELTKDGSSYTVDELASLINSANLAYDMATVYVAAKNDGGRLALGYRLPSVGSFWDRTDVNGFSFTAAIQDNAGILSARASAEANEERVYTWTWICDTSTVPGMADSGLTVESPPAPPSDPIMVSSTGSVVKVTFPTNTTAFTNASGLNPEGVKVTGKRLYRATAGEYLLVAELPLSTLTYTDAVPAADLGEVLPTLEDALAPSDLQGLINLPNGMVAGFTGRDLYFCRPYVPYAWPTAYSQTLDYPVVGLGRLDTTLVALTKGVPYFIQGAAPDVLTVVKSDIEQACVAKRSIVSLGGAVLFASPDGLIMLSTNGSKNVTEALFRREQWQALLGTSPDTTFHAYGHDNQYIAFHGKVTESYSGGESVDYYGFIYDLASGQFTRHNLATPRTGFVDLRNDQLFLLDGATLSTWGEGSYLTARWRSKKFSLPQISGFACAQVEADNAYAGLKATLYRDGAKVTTELSGDVLTTVTASRKDPRYPFRLEPKQGRDWEAQLDWTATASTPTEVFNIVIAQSMSEVASA